VWGSRLNFIVGKKEIFQEDPGLDEIFNFIDRFGIKRNKHPEVAKALYSDRQWLSKHPEVAKEACKNEEYMSKDPKFAEFCKQHRR
jgi:hypothetical protein